MSDNKLSNINAIRKEALACIWSMSRSLKVAIKNRDDYSSDQIYHMANHIDSLAASLGDDAPLQAIYKSLENENVLGVFDNNVQECWKAYCNAIAQELNVDPAYGQNKPVINTKISIQEFVSKGIHLGYLCYKKAFIKGAWQVPPELLKSETEQK